MQLYFNQVHDLCTRAVAIARKQVVAGVAKEKLILKRLAGRVKTIVHGVGTRVLNKKMFSVY